MLSFFKKRADVLDHWIAFCDDFQLSPSEFYDEIERELDARKIPKLEMKRIDFAEGGLLSGKRIYLRMLRERLVFDVCAAPFGKGFFFSCRIAEIRAVVYPIQIVASILTFLLLTYLTFRALGSFYGFLTLLVVLPTLIYLLRNMVALGLQDLDRVLQRSPLFGSIYAVFFRKETYYRIDTRLCYVNSVSSVVKKLAERASAQKGIQLVEQFELNPLLGDIYKRRNVTSTSPLPQRFEEPRVSI